MKKFTLICGTGKEKSWFFDHLEVIHEACLILKNQKGENICCVYPSTNDTMIIEEIEDLN